MMRSLKQKPRKKSNWMKGFVLPERSHVADRCTRDTQRRILDYQNKRVFR